MTNQITKYAMFAIAAFALSGMLVSPAFADDQITTNYVNDTPNGQTQTSATDHDDCGNGGDCYTYTKVYNTGNNKIRTYYNVVGETCDVNIHMEKNGNPVGSDYERSNFSGTGSYVGKYTSISPTDNVTVTTTFTC